MTTAELERREAGVQKEIDRATDNEEREYLLALQAEMNALTDPDYRELYEESLWQQEVMDAVTEYGAYHYDSP